MSKAHDRNRARRRLALRIGERVCEYLVYNEREFDLVDVAGLIEAMLPLTRTEMEAACWADLHSRDTPAMTTPHDSPIRDMLLAAERRKRKEKP